MLPTVLFFGSFNPVHNGHTTVARYVLEHGLAGEVWLVVSPQNPFKHSSGLAPERDRVKMAEIATAECLAGLNASVCDVELSMPRPSYTIDTIGLLRQKYPQKEFSMLVGADIPEQLHLWKNYEQLISEVGFIIYPRPGYTATAVNDRTQIISRAGLCDISSTTIRQRVRDGRSITAYVSPGVNRYIQESKLWL